MKKPRPTKTISITFRISEADHTMFCEAAEIERLSLSAWARRVLVVEAERRTNREGKKR